ncbi:transmembrane protein, putative (macronuclear) [Tetrahymena thermophila SB210]|uniref:Transmembrane protein, putative n=1 Tax=Tetrahymena thermophila (strain SB210) TaxID=312017 RepID=W7XJH2_TETTS|nr:transmembrane protein, putative [Tetrahymena thermophila SB210]EWS74159.1 transmembrane protein, putative [Tetrahymena thermophila SB210]|eukprot:XP_012653299.1 transmembrane protein, putative [Tetrahymena thermophila SB210]
MGEMNNCYNQCYTNDTFYNVTLCALKNSYGCGAGTEDKSFLQKLFDFFFNCLVNSRITEQCHNDEYFTASNSGTNQQKLNAYNTNINAEQILEEYVYSNCTSYLVQDFSTYLQCYNDTFQQYNDVNGANYNSDAANLGSGRLNYYTQENTSIACYQQDVSLCSNYQEDLANCEVIKLNLGCVFSAILLVLSNLFFIYILF